MNEFGSGDIIEVARGISDLGMLIISASVFILISAVMMITMFVWFRTLINGIIKEHQQTMEELLAETKEQNAKLIALNSTITEVLTHETLPQIKDFASLSFELSKERVCRLIKKIREENHIADRECTAEKIRNLLTNIHEERNGFFESRTFRGQRLTAYVDKRWIEQVALIVEAEIYNVHGANNGRAYTNVSSVYDHIKNDFFHNLIN